MKQRFKRVVGAMRSGMTDALILGALGCWVWAGFLESQLFGFLAGGGALAALAVMVSAGGSPGPKGD